MDGRELLPPPPPRIHGADGTRQQASSKREGPLGSRSNPRAHNQQDYDSLLRSCLQRRSWFADPTFPADRTSIGDSKAQVAHWRRPHQIHRNPQFVVDGITRFDVCQGTVGDCWFLAALASLTMQQDLFAHVVPHNQDFQRNYFGIFHFRFWHFGDWVDVVVDDRLPTDEWGQLIFVQSCAKNEFWCALMEKAYAKLCGSYGDLQMGTISEAMVDFTGGIKLMISLTNPPSDLWKRLTRAAKLGSFMGCSMPSVKAGEQVLANGLVMTHAYSVTGIEEVLYKNRTEELVRVRNPWGNQTEWNGRWSDRSVQWSRIDPEVKERLLLSRNDGEFWMAMQDFTAQFSELTICSLTPDFLKGENQQKWALSLHRGSWRIGSNAGGCMENNERFCINPQYSVTLSEGEMSKRTKTCSFTVSLLQKPRDHRRNKSPRFYIACHVFKVPPTLQVQNGKLPEAFFKSQQPVKQNTKYTNTREVCETYQLEPGTYVLVPCTYNPNEQAEFILRIYFRKRDNQKDTNSNSNLQNPTPELSRQDDNSWERIFDKYAQTPRWPMRHSSSLDSWNLPLSPDPLSPDPLSPSMEPFLSLGKMHHNSWSEGLPVPMSPTSPTPKNPEIDAAGLQMILNKVFLEDQKRLEGFSLDNCRGIVLLMDFSGTGKLNKHDFRRLWNKLAIFKDLFHKRDVDDSGFLDLIQLSDSFQEVGFGVTNSALKLMALRYGDSTGRISLESFINCFLRVEFTTKMYNKLSRGGSGLYLNGVEWMLLTTYL
uniref:calpain-14-like n=1 Tax=Pristiophorus japonicus TaxID=55135 RepID=UPI00398F662A